MLTPETIITLVRTFEKKSSTLKWAEVFLRQFSGWERENGNGVIEVPEDHYSKNFILNLCNSPKILSLLVDEEGKMAVESLKSQKTTTVGILF